MKNEIVAVMKNIRKKWDKNIFKKNNRKQAILSSKHNRIEYPCKNLMTCEKFQPNDNIMENIF